MNFIKYQYFNEWTQQVTKACRKMNQWFLSNHRVSVNFTMLLTKICLTRLKRFIIIKSSRNATKLHKSDKKLLKTYWKLQNY